MPLLDLTDAILDFADAQTYTVTRTPKRPTIKGRLVPTVLETFEISALVVPVSGDDVAYEPKGDYVGSTKTVFSTVPLNAVTVLYEPDSIMIDGSTCQVYHAESWAISGFYKALVYAVIE